MRSFKLALFAHLTRIWYNIISAVVTAVMSTVFILVMYFFQKLWK